MPKSKKAANTAIDIDWEAGTPNESEIVAEETQPVKPSTMVCEDCGKANEDCGNHYGKILCESCYQEAREKKRLERLEREQLEQEKQNAPVSSVAKLETEIEELRTLINQLQVAKGIPAMTKKYLFEKMIAKQGESGAISLLNWFSMNKKQKDFTYRDNGRGASLGILIDIFNEYLDECLKTPT